MLRAKFSFLRNPQVILGVVLVALALAARLIPGPRTIDDSYITFRYARNLLAGQGLVYNPGEAVLGTTTPLYTFLMAALGAFSGGTSAPFPQIAWLVNALADALTCLLLVRIGQGFLATPAGVAKNPVKTRSPSSLGEEGAGGWRGFAPWAAGFAWAVAPFSVSFSIGGLETSLYVLLLSGLALAALEERHVLAALLAALALLTRPDALILIGPVAAVRGLVLLMATDFGKRVLGRMRSRPHPPAPSPGKENTFQERGRELPAPLPSPEAGVRFRGGIAQHPFREGPGDGWGYSPLLELAAFLLPILAWGVYATLTFGSPLPHSIAAKVAAYHLEAGDALVRLIQHYATPFLEQDWLGSAAAVLIGLLLYPLLYLLGARRVLRRARQAGGARAVLLRLPWLLYPWLYLVTFALPNPLIFRWYLTPPLPAYFLFIFIGMESVLRRILNHGGTESLSRIEGRESRVENREQKIENRKSKFENAFLRAFATAPFRAVVIFILLIWALSPLAAEWRIHPDHGPDRPAPQMAFIQLELLYRQAAELLAPRLTPNSLLAAGDVGVLGYYTPARILDTVGLNSPISTAYYPLPDADYVINYAIPAALILEQRPDYLVMLEVYGRNTLLKDAQFLKSYSLLQTIPTELYGSQGMLIYQRSAISDQ